MPQFTVLPPFTVPPAVVDGMPFTVHCGAKLAVSVKLRVVPVADPTVGWHVALVPQPLVQGGGLDVQPVKR